MSSRLRLALGVLTLVVAACGIPATAPADGVGSQESTAPTTVDGSRTTTIAADAEKDTPEDAQTEKKTDFECPVTVPTQPGFEATKPEKVTYSEHFPAPDPWPSHYPHEGMVWYGSKELWTALAIDGDHSPRKSVWWSVNFPGGVAQGEPEVWVTWSRLDAGETTVMDNDGKATNAFTPEEGWFMIAGGDPQEPGCWEVEATYKGATLSYVYEKAGAQPKATADTEEVEAKPSKGKDETLAWPDSCPVTVLGKGDFTPSSQTPDGPPELYDAVWYGTPELYTMINPDGKSSKNRWLGGEKTLWWSKDFSVSTEPEPGIEVRARRLDGEATYESDQTTHGIRDDIGDFMLGGVTIPEPGCWELTATYRGASLSYVIWVDPNS